ncbi:cation-translocating P-type ATPase [Extibacter muris]|uniref:cation-translocating P-type ATPase n=1 Tax=Extibacter muris TaxID=1796622 RepID=UPI001D075CAA|nr:cation-translocating P-type ATPase [Extibacter muris]MCB6202442.1 cation-translocating P-type ATPase [Extibacter muris]MCQ4664933.1 cation-translocating P-type ATPase [Extibacter muris]MCQ4694298.1 cation-translocating P-type ATPase [Extibacter muris]
MFLRRKSGYGTETEEETYEYEEERAPITRYEPDYREGLSARQVKEHAAAGYRNVSVEPPAQTVKEIIHENVFTYFNLIFAVLAVLLCLVGSFRNLTFLPVIIANTLIGIVQEIRAKKILEKLTMLNAPQALAVREGRTSTVDSEELVLDDIVIFKAGNQICADAVVAAGEVQVNESLLTGESDEITKKRGDRLMSGSFVVAGQCHARLEYVGADSYISKLTLEAKAMQKGEQSEMMRSLNKLVKFIGIALIPIGIALVVQSLFFNHETLRGSITSMVAAVIGMIPEGLYLLASVALAVSSMRLAKQKVLLHDMKSIETLARVDVLCVDKTGTITENTMSVKRLVPVSAKGDDSLSRLVGDFALAMSSDNSTMEALKSYFKEHSDEKPVKVTPFTSKTKYSGVTYEDKAHVLGAPEFILRDDYETYKEEIQQYAGKGYRVLVFADYDGEIDGKALTGKAAPLAYILLSNPVRKEAPETFAYFAEQGVEVKVISGDNPLTVSEVAKEAGIKDAESYVDAATLHTDEDIADAIAKYTVFGRVTPAQKRQFVQALKSQGRTVAMTGDGVNDVLALKDADCSVAMASGSEAAVQASQVVLLESDFSCMPSVVLEGRRVVNNIQRSASLFLVKNIFSFLLSLFSVAFMITYPLEPSQISLISMFTIGIPAFFLALQPNKEVIKGHFLTNVFLKALPAGLTDVLAVGALVVFGGTFGVSPTDISTAATMLLAIVGFMILFKICQPLNTLRVIVWIGSIIGLLACSIFLPDLFAITGMSVECIMLFVVFSIATEPVLRYLTLLVGWLRQLYRRRIKKEAGE